ncbi:hypothetical protein ACFX12_030573 [Malus domestica]
METSRKRLEILVHQSTQKEAGIYEANLNSTYQIRKLTSLVRAWEIFLELRPKPNVKNFSEPRLARWDNLNGMEIENLRKVLDSAGAEFKWRPYALDVIENLHLPKYCPQKETWVLGDISMKYKYWWKKSVSGLEDESEAASPQKKKAKSIHRSLLMVNHPLVSPGFP